MHSERGNFSASFYTTKNSFLIFFEEPTTPSDGVRSTVLSTLLGSFGLYYLMNVDKFYSNIVLNLPTPKVTINELFK